MVAALGRRPGTAKRTPPTPPFRSWTTSDDSCGPACSSMAAFKKDFRDEAVGLEKSAYTRFTPRYVTRKCPSDAASADCRDACIHKGRYCAWAAVADAAKGKYKGRDVAEENKRQLCVFNTAAAASKAWLWWEYAAGVATSCTMAKGK